VAANTCVALIKMNTSPKMFFRMTVQGNTSPCIAATKLKMAIEVFHIGAGC
jgi:hypothetical protein